MKTVSQECIPYVLSNNTLPDYSKVLVAYCQNPNPKISLQSIEFLKNCCNSIQEYRKSGYFPLFLENQSNNLIIFPLLIGFQTVIKTCELEVRTKALNFLFDVLNLSGADFKREQWDMIFKEVLLPIFKTTQIKDGQGMWMNTTLINALRLLIALFSSFYEQLNFLIDDLLDLCGAFAVADNETLGKLGSDCMVSLVETNVLVFTDDIWDKIVSRIVGLLEVTSPNGLYFDASGKGCSLYGIEFAPRPHKREFNSIITKCVQHLLIIETVYQILSGSQQTAVYEHLSSNHLFKLGDALYSSYMFAKSFNNDLPLRKELHKIGFMKQLPNLLKQETSSVSCYIIILSKIYTDESRKEIKDEVEKRLIP